MDPSQENRAKADLTKDELTRYVRQLILPGIDGVGQRRLKQSRVLLVGMGGLGCPVAQSLSGAGVGRLTLVDHDEVSLSNLPRQMLYAVSDIGAPKVLAAKARLEAQNPWCEIVPHALRLTPENAPNLVADCDVVVDGTDNYHSRTLLARACHSAKKPLVCGAAVGFDGFVTTFKSYALASNGEPNPTFFCLMPEPPQDELGEACDTLGILGPVTALIGAVMALEVMRLLLDGFYLPDEPKAQTTNLVGKQLWVDGKSLRITMMDYAWRSDNALTGRNHLSDSAP